ncbi:hypothetical protein YQE_02820, partial [Dendroctonus ponderosae]
MFELFDSGNYTQVPTIIGVNSEEKISLANDIGALMKYAEGADETPSSLVPANFNYKADVGSYEVGKKIRSIYVGNETLAEHLGQYIRVEVKEQCQEKIKAYLRYCTLRTPESPNEYKQVRNKTKELMRKLSNDY